MEESPEWLSESSFLAQATTVEWDVGISLLSESHFDYKGDRDGTGWVWLWVNLGGSQWPTPGWSLLVISTAVPGPDRLTQVLDYGHDFGQIFPLWHRPCPGTDWSASPQSWILAWGRVLISDTLSETPDVHRFLLEDGICGEPPVWNGRLPANGPYSAVNQRTIVIFHQKVSLCNNNPRTL